MNSILILDMGYFSNDCLQHCVTLEARSVLLACPVARLLRWSYILQRRRAAEDAIASGDIVLSSDDSTTRVDLTRQGNASMYSDVSIVGSG